jgi:sugar fermentation stimulation protein A
VYVLRIFGNAMIPVHQFPPLQLGHLIKRYKRFLADIALATGQIITAHCPNTGPMTGVCAPGSPVAVSHQPSPKRKLAYTWELIRVGGVWVGINTSLPNKIVLQGLKQGVFAELRDFPVIKTEVPYGQEGSRVDFCLTDPHTARSMLVEVKNTTWCKPELGQNVAIFPDTETTRGQKHLRELMGSLDQRTDAAIVYFIHRGDCPLFRSGDEADPKYGELLRQAIERGVKVLPYRFQVDETGVYYLGTATLVSAGWG